ncbi:malectin domain-containing carbohydrate-binding protein, partial [Cyclobacterium salsum]|uniref:malectin domain-containing carbohydrate-binding protein n=1 Tax=Cyclobacterium salsum TaxID=2666329 RepID=UPI00139128F7
MKTKNNLFSNFYTILSSLLFGLVVVTQSQGQNISFDQSALDFKNFPAVNQGTSLKFGPDGRLYAAQLNGIIKILTINQTGLNKYEVIGEEVLDGVKQIPNHDDNGKAAFDNRNNRQITGITVEGTATNPVIYASSSDPKWGGPSGDKVLDTNSGVITRLTWTGTEWEVIDLVRGLPRSEENHSTNGLEFTMINGKPYLLVTSGGFTNAGAPSKNFAYISEYALSAAILSVDLDAIEAIPTAIDPVTDRMFKYDIPTLDDPSRPNKNFVYDPNHPSYDGIDINDPFGGNDGLNMGMLVEGGPVQIFSAGYRNSYDLVVTENNGLYVTDNGANTNWGGLPEHEGNAEMVSNRYLPDEPGGSSLTPSASGEYVDNQDQLILITSDLNTYTFGSFYGGHPTPVRANPGQPYQPGAIFPFNPGGAGLYTKFIGDDSNWSNITPDFSPTDHFRTQILQPIAPGTEGFEEYASNSLPVNWPPVPLSLANGAEADFIAPTLYNPNGPQPSVVAILPINSNGIDEYKASNFGGAIKGSLIAGKSGGTLHLVNLNPDGSLESMETNKWNLNGGNALGISCNGDNDIFPGTIWVATFDGRIMVLTPTDNLSCLSPEDPNFDPSADYDFDGYSNQDELDNGTDYCSGASIPNDYDNDFISDLNDLDDDGDGILDENDPFQLGYPMNLPVDNQLFTIQQDNLGRESGYLGLGLTGLMNNGAPNPNWLDWLDKPEERPGPADIYGGAAGAIQVSMTGGTANGAINNQEKGFQFGVNVGLESGKFTISSGLLGLSAPGSLYDFDGLGEVGIQIGDGTQSNFIKLVFTETHLVAAQEIEDVPDASPIMYAIPIENRPLSDELVEIGFDVEPLDGSVIPFYKFGNADKVSIGMIQTTGLIKEAIQNSTVPLAIGIFGTSNDWAKDFIAVWDYFEVVSERPYITKVLGDLEKIVNDPDEIIDLNQHFDDNKGVENLTYQILHNSNPVFDAVITGNFLTLGFPNEVNSSELTIRATDQDGFYVDQSFTVSTKLDEQVILRINAGGGILADESTNTDWKSNNIAGATSNEFFSVNTGKISNNTFDPINRHSSIPSYISDQLYAQIFSTERYSGLQSMQYQIPIENGDYLVKLYMGNGYDGTSQPGQRVFDILVEGQTVISQLDLAAKFGHKVGGMEQIPVSVTDGELNIDFQKSIENPLINGIEIIRLFGLIEHTPILFTPLENRINLPGDELDGSLFIEASGGDGNLSFSAQGLPPGIVIEPTNGTLYGTIAEDAYANSPYLVTITLDDEDGTDSDALSFDFTWTVSPPLTLQTWQVKNESQDYTGRHENSFVQAGDKFYLLGGREEPKKVDVYDYQTDTWQALQNSSPFDFNHFQAVEYEGLIWVIGAFKDNNFPVESPTDHIWAFDPVRQEWIQGPEIPQDRKRGSAGVVLYNNKFYIVNGNKKGHDGEYVNLFDEYDPLTGTWTVLENSPRARDHFFSTVVANKMYVVSGRQSGGDGGVFGPVIPEVDVYNFTTHTWSTLPVNQNIPTPRAAATVNNYLNKIIVAGGEVPDNSTALAITEMYDPQKEEWVSLKPMNFQRHGTQGIVSGKGLYVLGGSPTRGGGNQKNMEVFGFDEPKGSPLLASEITTVDTLFLKSGISENLTLNVENGNTGIFIRSIKIVGINTTDFVIHSGVLTNSLLRANSQHELTISYNGTEELIEADLVIEFGHSSTKTIPIKAGTIDHYNPITVANPIPDQSAQVNLAFNFTFAENTFYHSEAGGLNYTASLSDGNPLPTWLEFDGTSRTFSGIPTISSIGTISIRVTATDGTYNRSDEFVLTVEGENFTGLSGINSGGPQFTSGAGFVYDADNSFVGGSTYTNNNIADISGTTDDTMYRSERHGGGASFSYNVA